MEPIGRHGQSDHTGSRATWPSSCPSGACFFRTRKSFAQLKLDVLFIPSYSPKQPLAALLAARSLGISTVLMIDSHKGTMKARPLRHLAQTPFGPPVRRRGWSGGSPQMKYIESLGMHRDHIFRGLRHGRQRLLRPSRSRKPARRHAEFRQHTICRTGIS